MKKVTKITENTSDFTEHPKLRVAAYCRVSTDSDEQKESLDAQIKHYEAYIKANPEWEFAGLYYDVDTPYGLIQKACECLNYDGTQGIFQFASECPTFLFGQFGYVEARNTVCFTNFWDFLW